MRRCSKWGWACAAAMMIAGPCMAGDWTYTFDSTPWDTTLPLTNLAPDSGPAGFTTTFTASPLADSFEVSRWNGPTIVTGNSLLFNPKYISGTPAGNLTLTFSTNVSAVSLVIESAAGISGVTATDEKGDTQDFTFNADDTGIPVIQLHFAPTNVFSTLNLAFAPSGSSITFFIVGNIVITPPPPTLPAPNLSIDGGNLVVTWAADSFVLQSTGEAGGGFTDVPDATSPYTTSLSSPQMFFRLRGR